MLSSLLPWWVVPAVVVFLVLMTVEIGVGIWSTLTRNKNAEETKDKLDSIYNKTNITFMTIRQWQEERVEYVDPDPTGPVFIEEQR
jgi:predicted ATP-binding protein involved in virulence